MSNSLQFTPSGKPIGPKHRKIALLGGRGVGKSSLITYFVEGGYVDSYYPTIENSYSKTIKFKGSDYVLGILDTAGHDEFSILNPKHIIGYSGWVVQYAIDNPKSLMIAEVVANKIKEFTGRETFPMVLVGNKADLAAQRQVSEADGQALADKFKCPLIEASAKTSENVAKVFNAMLDEIEKENIRQLKASGAIPETATPERTRCWLM